MTTSTLTSLLSPNGYLLAYALPLFFASLVLTFAGAFLTLDRSRSFAPRYDALSAQKTKKFNFVFEGGIGGLLIGYSFGLHLVTFLALLIPNTSKSNLSPLSDKSFLATWLLSSLPLTFLGARYKYAALALAGITGGVVFSLSMSVIIHPSLLTRIILTCIITPILTVLTLLPLEKFQHPSLRFAASSVGAFGLMLSIALLAKIPAWAEVWERYWLKSNEEWGSSKEQGLSAGFCLFLVAGIAVDWLLRRMFGECPDEKWDSYLANYTSNLPNRAGTFKPFESFWDRWFASKDSSKGIGAEQEMIFPDDSKHPLNNLNVPPLHRNTPSPFSRQTSRTTLGSPKLTKFGSGAFSATTTIVEDSDYDLKVKESDLANDGLYHDLPPTNQGLLKKHRSKQNKAKRFNAKSSKDAHGFVKKKRDPVKFRPSGGFQSDSSDDDDDDDEMVKGKAQRPWLKQSPSMTSTATAVSVSSPTSGKAKNQQAKDDGVDLDYEKEMERIKEYRTKQGDVLEYSDYESDLGSPVKEKGNGEAWTPGFIRRASQRSGSGSGSLGASVKAGSNASTSTLVPPSPTTTSASEPPALKQPTPTSPNAGPPAFLSGLGAVPATPSLIKALDRVALAQKDAYSGSAGTGLPRVEEEAQDREDTKGTPANAQPDGKRWESFWREVRDKAAS